MKVAGGGKENALTTEGTETTEEVTEKKAKKIGPRITVFANEGNWNSAPPSIGRFQARIENLCQMWFMHFLMPGREELL